MINRKTGLLLAFVLALLAGCNDSGKKSEEFRVPAEFESQSAVWLSSPTVDYKHDWSMLETQAHMIKELITSVHVHYAVNEDGDIDRLRDALAALGVSADAIDERVHFHAVEHGDLWVRDTGGTFMKDGNGNYKVIDFDFDAYRMEDYNTAETNAIYQIDNDVSHRIAAALNVPVESSPLVAEGGNFHFNGKGTMLVVEKSLTMSNPGMTKTEIEEELKRVFNQQKVIFLPENSGVDLHPVLESPKIIDGVPHFNVGVWHVDELVTWLDDRTVLLPQVSTAELASGNPFVVQEHLALEAAYEVLSNATDQDGHSLTILRPEIAPEPIVVDLYPEDITYGFLSELAGIEHFPTDGSPIKFVLAASYMNYVITNDVILIPKLWKEGRSENLRTKDAVFKEFMEAQFPGRKIVQVENDALTVGGGGMHCITQQVPSVL